jgi:hypothetical protein
MSSNTFGNRVRIDHPGINGDPNAILFATHNWNPTTATGVYNDSNTGVYYDRPSGRWEVFNQDGAPMPAGAAFNILVADHRLASEAAPFVHSANGANVVGIATYIDRPELLGNPNAVLTVTPIWNPPSSVGVYNDHPIAVYYDAGVGRWAIVNQDGAQMPTGASFNVLIGGQCP